MGGVGIGEVPAEAPGSSVEVARLGRQVHEGEAIAVGRQVLPHGAEDAVVGEPILARHVQR
jgi:hypothetical protein